MLRLKRLVFTSLMFSSLESPWRRDERDRDGPRDEPMNWRRTVDRDGPARRGNDLGRFYRVLSRFINPLQCD